MYTAKQLFEMYTEDYPPDFPCVLKAVARIGLHSRLDHAAKVGRIVGELLDEEPPLYFGEANTGLYGNDLAVHLAEVIVGAWSHSLQSVGSAQFSSLDARTLQGLRRGLDHNFAFGEVKGTLRISLNFYEPKPDEPNPIIGAYTHDASAHTVLQVDFDSSGDRCLQERPLINDLALHEAKHVADYFKQHPTGKPGVTEYRYLSKPSEVVAYTTNVINEVKRAWQTDPQLSFEQALQRSTIWQRYSRVVFPKFPRMRNKMLAKVAHWWNTYRR